MTRIIGLWLYVASVVGLLCVAAQLSGLLAVFPPGHMRDYGPRVPHLAETQWPWIVHAPLLLCVASALAALAGVWLWRSRLKPHDKTFALAAIAALTFFVGMWVAGAVLAFWFLVPKAANMV